jgi:hypothetical protein
VTPHYVDDGEVTCLVFPSDWIGTKLPPQWISGGPDKEQRHFKVTLIDTETGKAYDTWMWCFYEDCSYEDTTVQRYMYQDHHCPCHRKISLESQIPGLDDECTGERFLIESITAPKFTGELVLYSEVFKDDQLDYLLEDLDAHLVSR